jgi:hypothetical protein
MNDRISQPEKPFDPTEYMQPILGVLNRAELQSERVITLSGVPDQAPYSDLDWADLYREREIAGDLAAEEMLRIDPTADPYKVDRFQRLVSHINRAGAMLEIDQPGFTRLTQLNNKQVRLIIDEVIKSSK